MIKNMTAWEMTSSTMTLVLFIIIQIIIMQNNKIAIVNVLESHHRRKRASHYHLHKGHHSQIKTIKIIQIKILTT